MILTQHKVLDEDFLVMPWRNNDDTLICIKVSSLQLSMVVDKDEARRLIGHLTDTLREIRFGGTAA